MYSNRMFMLSDPYRLWSIHIQSTSKYYLMAQFLSKCQLLHATQKFTHFYFRCILQLCIQVWLNIGQLYCRADICGIVINGTLPKSKKEDHPGVFR